MRARLTHLIAAFEKLEPLVVSLIQEFRGLRFVSIVGTGISLSAMIGMLLFGLYMTHTHLARMQESLELIRSNAALVLSLTEQIEASNERTRENSRERAKLILEQMHKEHLAIKRACGEK